MFMIDIERSSWPSTSASITASEAEDRPTASELEDCKGLRGKSVLLPHCDEVCTYINITVTQLENSFGLYTVKFWICLNTLV